MYNYLRNTNDYDGISEGTENSIGYWTMNARSDNPSSVWLVAYGGNVGLHMVGFTGCGARAVVEINK